MHFGDLGLGFRVPYVRFRESSAFLGMQILRGDGSSKFYRGRVFLGADGAPLTFQVHP
jgi:hypothetical protein